MRINSLTAEEALSSLVSSEAGLAVEEAARRLGQFGRNEIEEGRKRPLVLKFLDQFTHFLAIVLWVAAALSFLSEYLHPGGGMSALGAAIVAVIFINATFTFIQEYRAERAFSAMKGLLPFRVRVVRAGREKDVHAGEVVPGDIVLLSEGDRVPADARLILETGIRVNNAPLTGESEPVTCSTAPFTGDTAYSPNIVFAGTAVISGSGKAVVFATGMRTEFGRIARLTGAVTSGPTPLQKEIVKVSRLISVISVLMGVVFFAVGHLIGRTFWENFLFAVGIIVAMVPEGLLPTLTLSLAVGSQRMAKRKALIKELSAVETLGSVSVICTDKTGTLTQNRMTVRKVAQLGEAPVVGGPRPDAMTVALLCNNARDVDGAMKGDPTEVALYVKAVESLGRVVSVRIMEFPFDAEIKRMSTVNVTGGRTFVLTKGSPEGLFGICGRCLADGVEADFDENLKARWAGLYGSMMDEGLRVLAFAYRELDPSRDPPASREEAERDMVLAGMIGLEDPPRPEVPDAVERCRAAGIRIVMMTGDGSRTAVAVAREIGLVRGAPAVVEGSDFHGMSDQNLRAVLKKEEVIFSRMTPRHKLRVVNVLKEEGERVAVTGDGVNDAPALKRADVGVAMGVSGTDVAREAADVVLLDDNFATIVNAVEEGRAVYDNIKKFMSYILSSNVPEVVPYLACVLFRIPLPLTIMQILAVDLGTDMLPALALGAERPSPTVMQRPPRDPGERLLDASLLTRAYLFLGLIEAAAAMFGFFYVLRSGGWEWGSDIGASDPLYLQATTACLTAIVVTQVANVFACRSARESVFGIGLLTNRLIFAGVAFELALQMMIVYTPFGNKVFSTSPIPVSTWLVLLPFAFLLFFAEEARKRFFRLTLRRGPEDYLQTSGK